jgi:hypothetical protein
MSAGSFGSRTTEAMFGAYAGLRQRRTSCSATEASRKDLSFAYQYQTNENVILNEVKDLLPHGYRLTMYWYVSDYRFFALLRMTCAFALSVWSFGGRAAEGSDLLHPSMRPLRPHDISAHSLISWILPANLLLVKCNTMSIVLHP